MIYYLFPRDVFYGLGIYRSPSLSFLEVSDVFADGWRGAVDVLEGLWTPQSIELAIPSSVETVQALGYVHLAALGDELLSPHTWSFRFPLYLVPQTPQFLSALLERIVTGEPMALWTVLRSPDATEYIHIVASIAILQNLSLQLRQNEASLTITFSVPYSTIFRDTGVRYGVIYPQEVNYRGWLLRDTSVNFYYYEGETHDILKIPEITDFNMNIQTRVNWNYTTFDPSTHSIAALRAPNMYWISPVTGTANISVGYPFDYSDLQTSFPKGIYRLELIVRDMFILGLEGTKAVSWDFRLAARTLPSLTVALTFQYAFVV